MKRKLFQVHNSPKNGCYGKLKDAVMAATGGLTEYTTASAYINGKKKKTAGGSFTARNGATITVIFAEVVTAAKVGGEMVEVI